MIAIIDYNTCNCGSIRSMLKKVGAEPVVTSRAADLAAADKLILPGVGAFDVGMRNLRELKLIDVLNELVLERRVPILGICLGMQLFTRGSEERSEEGPEAGFGWIDADTARFRTDAAGTPRPPGKVRLPHMGWNTASVVQPSPLFRGIEDDPRFYFVHSFHLRCDAASDVLAQTEYVYGFPSAVARENILGTQFHPEKSHRFGMRLLHNFAHEVHAR